MAKAKTDAEFYEPVTADFVVIVDTREQSPFGFKTFRADSKHKRKRKTEDGKIQEFVPSLFIPTEIAGLKTGDYSIKGMEHLVTVERKSLVDLYQTLSAGRDRFERELQRMAEFQVADIVIESGFQFALQNPPRHTRFTAKSVFRSVNAWKQEFRNIHWNWCDSRELAEHVTFRILERFWMKQQEKLQSSVTST